MKPAYAMSSSLLSETAVKFTKQGQVKVEVDRLASSEEAINVLFSVADQTGPVIPD